MLGVRLDVRLEEASCVADTLCVADWLGDAVWLDVMVGVRPLVTVWVGDGDWLAVKVFEHVCEPLLFCEAVMLRV